MHSKAHTEFNQAWRKDDYQLDNFQAWLERQNKHVRNLPPKVQLAITSAFEHFTALLGGYILKHPEVLSTLDEDAMKLWVWHAIEEIEHRSVAFDVYQQLYADQRLRRRVMKRVTGGFLVSQSTQPDVYSCRINGKASLKLRVIYLVLICWLKCWFSCFQNICHIIKKTFILNRMIILLNSNTGKSIWHKIIR